MASLLGLLLTLAKAYPALARQIEQVAEEIRRQRLAATHDAIDTAVTAAQRAPWACPAACPHRDDRDRLHDARPASPALPPAS
jgi:TPP-dependent indolepyruvate ferredoxin oxidoreductase alpha subunit